ncbi:MAG TPA: ATP-grasp domain-containing protein [Euzebyales bacterium]
MPHLLLIAPAGSYRVGDHMAAARDVGCDVTVVTDAAIAMPGSAIVVSLCDPGRAAATVLARLDRPIDGVVGTDGPAVAVAGAVARRCGLVTSTAGSLAAAADKLAQRRACAGAGVPQPDFAVVAPGVPQPDFAVVAPGAAESARPEALLPAVVKPVDRTASQGVVRADTPAQLRGAVARVRRICGRDATVLVEQFVAGAEVAVDGLLVDGALHVLAMFDKPDAPSGPLFPETLLISPARLPTDVRERVVAVVERAAAAIGLTEGPIHAECRIDGDRVGFLELAARSIGGLCSRSVRVAGMRLEELVLRHALRLPLPAPTARAAAATGVLMLPVPRAGRLVSVHGVEHARKVTAVTGVVIAIGRGEQVVPLPDGDRYLGFVFARANDPDACEQALRDAWDALDVEIADGGPAREPAGEPQRLVGG